MRVEVESGGMVFVFDEIKARDMIAMLGKYGSSLSRGEMPVEMMMDLFMSSLVEVRGAPRDASLVELVESLPASEFLRLFNEGVVKANPLLSETGGA